MTSGLKLIITRPQPGAEIFAQAARRAGFDAVVSPVLVVEPAASITEVKGAGALIFTSANGVRLSGLGRFDGPVFTVGEATAAAARDAGFRDIATAGGDALSVIRLVLNRRRGFRGRIVHITGESLAVDIVAALAREGLDAERTIAYRTTQSPALSESAQKALAESTGLWVALFSARTAAAFIRLASDAGLTPRLSEANAACLSDAVARAAGAAKWRNIMIAPAATSEAMLSGIASSSS